MMRILLTIMVLMTTGIAFGQQALIVNERENILYCRVPNVISILVQGYSCDEVAMVAYGVKIKKADSCIYEVMPEQRGIVTLTIVSAKDSAKILGSRKFRAKLIPKPVATVARIQNGKISRNELYAQSGIVAELQGGETCARFVVATYEARVIKSNQLIFNQKIDGPYFPDELKRAFRQLSSGDLVLFSSVKYKTFDGQMQEINPIVLEIE